MHYLYNQKSLTIWSSFEILFLKIFQCFFLLALPPLFKIHELLRIRSILIHVLDHEPSRASEDVLNDFSRAALAYFWELFYHPVCKGFTEILQLQKTIPPFTLGPRPDGFYWIEVRWARRQESRSSSIRFQELLNLLTPVSSVVVHHYHFVEELVISFVLLVKVLDGLDVGGVGDCVREDIAVYTDGPNDGHIFLLVLGPLHYQRQHRALRLPDLWPCSPAVCGGLIHVDYLSAFHHELEDLLDICDSQFNHSLLTSSTVEAAVNLQIADVELPIAVTQSEPRHFNTIFLFQDPTPCIKREMCPFS